MQKSVHFYFTWLIILWLDIFIFIFTHAYNYRINFKNGFLIACTFFFLVKMTFKCLTEKKENSLCCIKSSQNVFQMWGDTDSQATGGMEEVGALGVRMMAILYKSPYLYYSWKSVSWEKSQIQNILHNLNPDTWLVQQFRAFLTYSKHFLTIWQLIHFKCIYFLSNTGIIQNISYLFLSTMCV
jgi:hypothetical protein